MVLKTELERIGFFGMVVDVTGGLCRILKRGFVARDSKCLSESTLIDEQR